MAFQASATIAFHKSRSEKLSIYIVGIRDVFRDKETSEFAKFSLLESATGNLNSLLSRKNSLFFLSPYGRPRRAKHSKLCSMPCGAARERGSKSQDFPVKFPASGEFDSESGSLETPPTAMICGVL
jgi:hypothetical protein